jgi:DNA-binding CsgD family transcriptional regulator
MNEFGRETNGDHLTQRELEIVRLISDGLV